mgnify:CR=1 FL=1
MNNKRKIVTDEGTIIGKFLTIDGLVIPVDWDEDGRAIAISISTLDEEEYLVLLDEKGLPLLNHLREEALIRGWFYKDFRHRKCIAVDTYII